MQTFDFKIKTLVLAEQTFDVEIMAETKEDAINRLRDIVWKADNLSDDLHEIAYNSDDFSVTCYDYISHNVIREATPHEAGRKDVRRLCTYDGEDIGL